MAEMAGLQNQRNSEVSTFLLLICRHTFEDGCLWRNRDLDMRSMLGVWKKVAYSTYPVLTASAEWSMNGHFHVGHSATKVRPRPCPELRLSTVVRPASPYPLLSYVVLRVLPIEALPP